MIVCSVFLGFIILLGYHTSDLIFSFVDLLKGYLSAVIHFGCVEGSSSGRALLLVISVNTAAMPTFVPMLCDPSVYASWVFLFFSLCCKKCYFCSLSFLVCDCLITLEVVVPSGSFLSFCVSPYIFVSGVLCKLLLV